MAKPDDSEKDCTTFDALFQPLESLLAHHERNHPPHHREALPFTGFVRLLVYHFTKGCESGRQLLTDTLSAAPELGLPEVKRSTFFDAFQRFPTTWFASLLSCLLAAVVWKAIPELDALGKLYCVDGSVFPALVSMLWAEYTSQHRAIRLHLCFELNRMLVVQFLVDTGKSNEKKALLHMLEAEVTYIADRGYLSFPLLAAPRAACVPSRYRPAGAFDQCQGPSHLSFGFVPGGPRTLLDPDQSAGLEHVSGHPVVRLPLAGGVDFQISETVAEWPASAQPLPRRCHHSLLCAVDHRPARIAAQATVCRSV
jgi:hypothetical protein